MRFLSVCSGIEAASVSWQPLGWQAVAFSEVDPFACAVLAHRFQNVPNWGDMTKFNEWPDATLDVFCGGTPCQSFSVAGLRRGLDDPRGNLMLTFGAIAARYRPKWLVWENVPGVLSSNGGRDFGSFLGLLGLIGYGFAYRVLDAQFVRVDGHPRAVPQRRNRVFVVGCLGDWRSAAAVLLERESLRGDSAPRKSAGARVAATLTRGAESSGKGGYAGRRQEDDVNVHAVMHGPQVSPALKARDYKGPSSDGDGDGAPLIAHTLRGDGFDASEDGTGRGTPLVPIAFAQNQRDELRMMHVAGALAAEPGMKQQTYLLQPAIAFDARQSDARQSDVIQYGDKTGQLGTCGFTMGVQQAAAVRRLTPKECERLQGFPDDWTLVPYRNKPAADGPRYRAIGNSWAVNCARWIGQRIEIVERITSGAEKAA